MGWLAVHDLPDRFAASAGEAQCCVVVDVLRATTTMIHALAAGALAVIPCLTVDEARRRAAELPVGTAVLGGERHGLPIEGFDLGNSPAEYASASVEGKIVVLTTTNGTRALLRASSARDVVIGGFVNLSASCRYVADSQRLDVICAGTDGHVTEEDVLLSGAVAERLASGGAWQLDASAVDARARWLATTAGTSPEQLRGKLVDALRRSRGGKNLVEIGMEDDILLAADVDRFPIVPRFNRETARVELSSQAPSKRR
jgi:2-phosphosulfolactate phosphatase